jgi:hypothetical protein
MRVKRTNTLTNDLASANSSYFSELRSVIDRAVLSGHSSSLPDPVDRCRLGSYRKACPFRTDPRSSPFPAQPFLPLF